MKLWRGMMIGVMLLPLHFGTSAAQQAEQENEGSLLEIDEVNQIYRLKWWATSGRAYYILHSEDLQEWNWLPVIEAGDDAVKEWGFTSTGDRFFARLRHVPFTGSDVSTLDSDANGLFDLWELTHYGTLGLDRESLAPGKGGLTYGQVHDLGLDPKAPSTNDIGIPDEWLVGNGLDPHTADPWSDDDEGIGDGLPLIQEYEYGTNPNLRDTDGDGTIDGEDGAALDPEISPMRLGETSYAVIEIGGISAGTLRLNNNSQALIEGSQLKLWSNGNIILESITLPPNHTRVSSPAFDDNGNIYSHYQKTIITYDEDGDEVYNSEDGHVRWNSSGEHSFIPQYVPAGCHFDIEYPMPFPTSVSPNGTLAFCAQWGRTYASETSPAKSYGGGVRFSNNTYTVIGGPAPYGEGNDQSPFTGNWVYPSAINNSNVAVGDSFSFNVTTSSQYTGKKIYYPDNSSEELTMERWWGLTSLNNVSPPQVVGYSAAGASSDKKAGMWVKLNGTWKFKHLGAYNPSSGQNAEVLGIPRKINNRFEIAGTFGLWRNGRIRLPSEVLDTDTWILNSVHDINDHGVIAGYATKKSTQISRPVLLLPIEIKVVDRDDQTKTWSDAKYLSPDRPVYAGYIAGDMVSWKIMAPDSWTSVHYKWTAEGPNGETINGPDNNGANEWKFADSDEDTNNDWLKDEDWKPGKWKIKCKITFQEGGSSEVELEQEIGTRTEQYVIFGSIQSQQFSSSGVQQSVITQWGCPEIGFSSFAAVGGGVNDQSGIYFVPFNETNRVYINQRLLNATSNQDPETAIDPEVPVDRACGLDPVKHFRAFSAGQFRFNVDDDGKLSGDPFLIKENSANIVGTTPIPCTGANRYGTKGQLHADSGKVEVNPGNEYFSYLLKFRVGAEGQTGFANMNGRNIPWVFFRYRFEAKDGLIDTQFDAGPSSDPNGSDSSHDYSSVPTFYVYVRYYDIYETKWKLWLQTKLDEDRRPFLSIGEEVSSAPFVMP